MCNTERRIANAGGAAATLFLLLIALASGAASAQDDPARAGAARALFSEGVDLSDQGDWAGATERFRRALSLRASSVIAYNLALALDHTGHVVEAAELLRGVIRDDGADVSLRDEARAELARAEPRIAWATIRVDGVTADDLTLQIDDRTLSSELVGVAIPVDAGTHHISLVSTGRASGEVTVVLAEGERTEVSVTLQAAPAAPVDEGEGAIDDGGGVPAPAADAVAPTDDLWLWLGIGGAVVVVGVTVAVVAVVVTSSPATPFSGNLGVLEVGR